MCFSALVGFVMRCMAGGLIGSDARKESFRAD